MSKLTSRIDVLAETLACERILALDEARLNLELSKAGLEPEGLARRLAAGLGVPPAGASGDRSDSGGQHPHPAPQPSPPQYSASTLQASAALAARAHEAAVITFEMAGRLKFFDASKAYGFFESDGNQGDVLVHIVHLREAGYQTVYEGARIHALVHKTPKGLQVYRIISIDQSSAIHPSQLPPRTREKVQAESDWVRVSVKWYSREKGYGFVSAGEGTPDALVHADTLRRWSVAPLCPRQVVEVRWGMSTKGRMVAEIRHPEGLSGLPPVH